MSTTMESVRVVIFGSEYSIKGDVDVETTRQIARYVNSKMVEIHENTASRDNVKIAVLSSLNIAGELFELKGKKENGTQEISMLENRIASINQKIDAALKLS
jgi:cell division protein ZapA (FtsZ GTPase activity inhibitor)